MLFGRRLPVRLVVVCSALLAATGGAGCGSSPTSPSASVGFSLTAQYFTGSLSPGATSTSYSLNVGRPATVSLALVSLTDGANNLLPSSLSLTIGTKSTSDATPCTPIRSQTTSMSLATALSAPLDTGTYCVTVKDPGTLPLDVNFAVRITEVVGNSTTIASATIETFSSFLQAGATAMRTVTILNPSSPLTVTLTGSGTPSLALGLAVGTWDGAVCRPAKTVNAKAGTSPQLSVPVDLGVYCVLVSDIGNITTDHITFTVNIGHS